MFSVGEKRCLDLGDELDVVRGSVLRVRVDEGLSVPILDRLRVVLIS